jgi:hypothetical protein
MDDRPKEDSDIISSPQSREDNRSHSPHMALAPPAMASQESITAIDGQSATFLRSALMIPELNDPGKPQLVAEATDGKQEWEISDIIGKEVVDGEIHYLVEWSATLVPKCELGKAKVLVDKFEARLRAQCRQRGGKTREAASTEGRQAGNCGSSRSRRDSTEGRARPTSEAGVRPAIAGSS